MKGYGSIVSNIVKRRADVGSMRHELHQPGELRDRLAAFAEGRIGAGDLASLSSEDLARIAQLGIASLRAGMFDRATRQFELLLALRPDLYLPHHYLALIDLKLERFERAVPRLDRAALLIARVSDRPESLERLRQGIALLALETVRGLGFEDEALARRDALLALGDELDPVIADQLLRLS